MLRRSLAAVAAAVFVVVVGALGAGASTTGTPHACSVLSPAVAKGVIGKTAHRTRKAQPNPHMTQCVYTSKTGAITLLVGDWDFIKIFGGGSPGNPAKKVKHIGDEAYVTKTGLIARKGDRGVDVTVLLAAGTFSGNAAKKLEARQAAAEKLAPKLLAKL
jgi:hypothetical protein